MKDMLENSVEDKYYLSDDYLKYAEDVTIKQTAIGNNFKFEPIERERERR